MATVAKRNGAYRIRVSIIENGKKVQRSMTWKPDDGMSKKEEKMELNKQISEFERTVNKGNFVHSITFRAFTTRWMVEYAEKNLRLRTIERYESIIKKLNEYFGDMKLLDIEQRHIRSFLNKLSGNGVREDIKYRAKVDIKQYILDSKFLIKDIATKAELSNSTMYQITHGEFVMFDKAKAVCDILGIEITDFFEPSEKVAKPLAEKTQLHYYRLLSLILNTAVEWEVIPENNAKKVRAPKVKRKNAKYLDEEQVGVLIQCLMKQDLLFKTLIISYLYTGCRRAELLALRWDDINLKKMTISISKTLLYLPQHGLFTDYTKTEESNRVISISRELAMSLELYKKWQDEQIEFHGEEYDNNNYVFANMDGSPIRPDRITQLFSRFIKNNDLPDISLHSLRHTSATLQIMGGVPIRAVADRLGHAKTSTTLDIYSHALRSANEYGAEVLSNVINYKPSGFLEERE